MSNGAARSLTDASPLARRARIARRVGSASAANVVLRGSVCCMSITTWLYNLVGTVHRDSRVVNPWRQKPISRDRRRVWEAHTPRRDHIGGDLTPVVALPVPRRFEMQRRPLTILIAIAMALGVVASPVAAASPFPARIDLPSGWMPEGITAGRGNTIYVGSLAGGGVWAGDVRTGEGRPDRRRTGAGRRPASSTRRAPTACGSPVARRARSVSTTPRAATCFASTRSRRPASSTTWS